VSQQPRRFGKYLLLDAIGSGGMAEVWRARHYGAAGFERTVVIKKMHPQLASNDSFIRMFIDEAKLVVGLRHANVVQIYDLGAMDEAYFIAMEYVFGKDLLQLLIRCSELKLRVPEKLAVYITVEFLQGLELAHSASDERGRSLGVVHRDVSPSNVLIGYDGAVKIGDFGVARARQAGRKGKKKKKGKKSATEGKMGYMSPEQVSGEVLDPRSDIFCAGIILYEMLAMNRLFRGKTDLETVMLIRDCDIEPAIARLPPDTSPALLDIMQRALARDSAGRYPNAGAFGDALLDHLFNHKTRVGPHDMGRFMKSVFAKEMEDEAARHAAIDRKIERTPSILEALRAGPRPMGLLGVPNSERTVVWSARCRFRLRDRAGDVVGPMSLETLRLRVREEGLAVANRVSVDDSAWLDPRDLPGLLNMSAQGHDPHFTGEFGRFDFPRLLYRYAACHADGRMTLSCDDRQKEIYWRYGRPEHVTSNLRGELLGQYLLDRRIVSRETLDRAFDGIDDFAGHLGDALVQMGAITPHALFEVLSQQITTKLLEVFGWPKGQYAFYRGERARTQIVPLETTAYALITQGVERRLTFDELKDHFMHREDLVFRRLRHRRLTAADLRLSTKKLRIFNAISDAESILEQFGRLVAIPGVDEGHVYQVLFLMERLEFAKFDPPT
jgi:serine/threonine protein kinase